jgi:arylsulfatase A-like enzyme
MATLAQLVDFPLPEDAGGDSMSFLDTLLAKQPSKPIRETLITHSAQGNFAIRQWDWVLILAPTGDDNRKQGEPDWFQNERGYRPHKSPGELYHLGKDPTQKENLYESEPARVQEMARILETCVTEGRSTPGRALKNDVEVIWDKRERKSTR